MRKRALRTWLPVLMVAVATLPALAGDLPSADKVIAKYVKAIGGEKAFKKFDSRTITGTMSMPAAGISGGIKVSTMAPNLMLVEVEIPGVGTIREGFDGKVGWSTDPMSGPQLKSGKQLQQATDQARYDGALYPAALYKTREVVEQTEFNGRQAYKVRLVSANDIESFVYFDVENGRQLGGQQSQETPMGALPVTATVSDYKEFDGVMMPTRIEQDLGPAGKQILEFTSVTGGDVDPKVFELPAEIRALVE
jgi:hypothetical protein